MKTKTLALFLLTLVNSTMAFAQKSNQSVNGNNLLFVVRQQEHIVQALKTIEYLSTCPESSVKLKKAVIIVCGEAVVNLTTKDAEPWVAQIKKLSNVSLMACGLSLEKFKKKEADLIPGIQYTQNGLIKAFELQKEGYLSVEL